MVNPHDEDLEAPESAPAPDLPEAAPGPAPLEVLPRAQVLKIAENIKAAAQDVIRLVSAEEILIDKLLEISRYVSRSARRIAKRANWQITSPGRGNELRSSRGYDDRRRGGGGGGNRRGGGGGGGGRGGPRQADSGGQDDYGPGPGGGGGGGGDDFDYSGGGGDDDIPF